MEMLPLMVLLYLLFHAFMLKIYDYRLLFWHTIYIVILQIYLSNRKQNKSYIIKHELYL